MRKPLLILALAVAALTVGCASVPPTESLTAAPSSNTLHAVATLATNACEAETAADYTSVIVARRQAARLLRGGKIPVAAAIRVQQLADQARTALDAACPRGKPDHIAIATARAARAQIHQVLEAHHAH